MLVQLTTIVLNFMVFFVYGTLTPQSIKSNVETFPSSSKLIGPQNSTVFQRNLVKKSVNAKEILRNHQAYFHEVDDYNLPENTLVLGYVTPWNNHGYGIARIFGNKFTHISPVWLEIIIGESSGKFTINGLQDVDTNWMVNVKNAGRQRHLKIVPRIMFGFSEHHYQRPIINVIQDPKEVSTLCEVLIQTANSHKFNGYVLDIWTQMVPLFHDNSDEIVLNFIREIGIQLREQDLDVILAIIPQRGSSPLFSRHHFNALYNTTTAFSLMTYDYSNRIQPGPNSPIAWIRDSIKYLCTNREQGRRRKILTGFNFYGNDYYTGQSSDTIIAHEYVKKLRLFNGNLTYNEDTAEHQFTFRDKSNGDRHTVYYPTLYSIQKRLELCKSLGTGVSIWELGQGLDYFYDLL